MHIYINFEDDKIAAAKYLCTCDPTANVVVEVLCSLLEGKTIAAAAALSEDSFAVALGSRGEDYLKKSRGIIQLLHRGLERYQAGVPKPKTFDKPAKGVIF